MEFSMQVNVYDLEILSVYTACKINLYQMVDKINGKITYLEMSTLIV